MEYREFKGKTVQEAITEATIALAASSDNIEYEVVAEGSTGVFGLFSKDAVIRARVKEEVKDEEEKIVLKAEKPFAKAEKFAGKNEKKAEKSEAKAEKKAEAKKDSEAKAANKKADKSFDEEGEEAKAEFKASRGKDRKFSDGADEKTEKSFDEGDEVKAEFKASRRQDRKSSDDEEEVFFKKQELPENYVPASYPKAEQFLKDVLQQMGIGEVSLEVKKDEGNRVVSINVDGADTGDLIGKRGQTLDAIQYLVSIIVNKDEKEYYRIKLDTKDYRDRRQKTLENLAKNIASKVKKTRHKVVLEPMNPYERRIIHAYLQADKFVTTKSEGEEPNRRVVVYYKNR